MPRSNDFPSDFQSIILALQHFWADQGCLIWQPYYTQVGAGTMNPATFLRVLGPEPWNVAYVEPSVRPDDGRYGENPNRFQMHYQLQVILKPDPGNPQEIYLKSLEALGIDSRRHDIRFVEDNWESPALGAWGLGWEVWLDGQEITQFTYFQQAGGIVLNPVSVEITYGLDRIAMALQRVSHFRQLRWNEELTAGDLNYQGEFEHSKYYFEIADVDRLRQMYTLFEAEAEAALAANLVLPAHDYILKCSHTFNVLDTRGAVGVTERQALFGRMRDLSRRVAEAYLAQRQQLEYPFLHDGQDGGSTIRDGRVENGELSTGNRIVEKQDLAGAAPFLLEIGTEELPASDLDGAIAQLERRVPAWLDDLHLAHGGVRVMGTPRRLVVFVEDLAARQEDREVVHKGPPAERAFDLLGAPTKAAEGFARSRGVALADLQVREMDGGRYTVAVVQEKGQPSVSATGGVLSSALPGLLAGIKFDKPMRWNSSGVTFSRPVRWLLALHGGRVVPFEYAGLRSGRVTRGLRFIEPEQVEIGHPQDYFAVLEQQGILLDPEIRRASVSAQVEQHTRKMGGMEAFTPGLVDEVTNLVERPTAFTGRFENKFLDLPNEVLISVMEKHQRYFSVLDQEGKRLLPHFIGIRNGDEQHLEVVTDGNEQVIRARFADAAFFIQEDLKQPLVAYVPKLATLMFQKKLGSMLDKTRRIQRLVDELLPVLSQQAQAAPAAAGAAAARSVDTAVAQRAAELSKADLMTRMVVEMTSLQGVMGAFYARRSGESEEVALAIFEHYLPRSTGDQPPGSLPGLVVGLADRLDTLTGLFAAGLAPSGTRDPFAQRRAALGLVQSLIAWDMDFDLRLGLRTAASVQPVEVSEQSQAASLDFITGRLRGLLLDQAAGPQGYRYDVVDAVLAEQGHNPAGAAREVKALAVWVKRPDWVGSRLPQILPAYARCVRITRDQPQVYPVDPAAFVEADEHSLYQALQAAEAASRRPGSVDDFLNAFLPMIPAINRFFDTVLVMAEDEAVRRNRLGLLQRIAALADGVADLSRLEGF